VERVAAGSSLPLWGNSGISSDPDCSRKKTKLATRKSQTGLESVDTQKSRTGKSALKPITITNPTSNPSRKNTIAALASQPHVTATGSGIRHIGLPHTLGLCASSSAAPRPDTDRVPLNDPTCSSAEAVEHRETVQVNSEGFTFTRPRPGYAAAVRYASGRLMLNVLGAKGQDGVPLIKRFIEPPDGSILYGNLARREGFTGKLVVDEENWFSANMLEQMLDSPVEVAGHVVAICNKIVAQALTLKTRGDGDVAIKVHNDLTFHADDVAANLLEERVVNRLVHERLELLTRPMITPSAVVKPIGKEALTEIAALTWLLHNHHKTHREIGVLKSGHLQLGHRMSFKLADKGTGARGIFGHPVVIDGLKTDLCRTSQLLTGSDSANKNPALSVTVKNRAPYHWVTRARDGDFAILDLPKDVEGKASDTTHHSQCFEAAVAQAWERQARLLIVGRDATQPTRDRLESLGLRTSEPSDGQGPTKRKRSSWIKAQKRLPHSIPPQSREYIVAVNFDPESPLLPVLPLSRSAQQFCDAARALTPHANIAAPSP
jgi:hypothetical protein